MKRDIFYTLRKQSIWVTMSGALMGLPFLIQAIYYLLVRSITDVWLPELLTYMIIPMAVEFLWCLMLHVFSKKNTLGLGITACLVFLVLIGHSLLYNDLLRIIFASIAYVAVAQLVILILSGRFPYKLFGTVAVLIVLLVRILSYTYPLYIQTEDWLGLLTKEGPGVCMLAAVWCVFFAIEPHKKEEE